MGSDIRRVEYYRATVKDEPGAAFTVLSALSSQGVNLVAFTAIPIALNETQLILFPDSSTSFAHAAAAIRMPVDGPHSALLVQGDDALGAIAEIHGILADEDINVVGASGVADGRGAFGYVIHLRESDVDRAAILLRHTFAMSAG
jgi:predicted amino acid-binding ACT domain protein